MSLRGRLLLFGYPLLEVATAYLVALAIGWGWMLLLLVIGIPIGFALMRNAADAAMAELVATQQEAQRTGQPPAVTDGGRHALAFVGGLLIAIPGFWTDLLGLLLVVPLTQRLFRSRSRRWFESRFTAVRMPGVHYPSATGYADGPDVIRGTVIRREDEPS